MRARLEPTLILQSISALLAFGVTFGLDWLTTDQAGLIVALIAAVFGVVNALHVRPIAPAVFQTLITAGAALLTAYGLRFSPEMVGAFQVLVTAVVAMLTRVQVTPTAAMNPTTPRDGTVA